MEWHPREDSAAALLDQEHYLKELARDLVAHEAPKRTPAPDTVSRRDLDAALESICAMIGKACRELVVAPLVARIAELEAREWVGVWTAGKSYPKNAIVTHDGSAWVATRDHPHLKPGAEGSGWRLIVKRGRDAR